MYINISIGVIFVNMILFVIISNNMSKYGVKKLLIAMASIIFWSVCNLLIYVSSDAILIKYSRYLMFFFIINFSTFICYGSYELVKKKNLNIKLFVVQLFVPILYIILSTMSIMGMNLFKFYEINIYKTQAVGLLNLLFEIYCYVMGIITIVLISNMEKKKNKYFRLKSLFIVGCILAIIICNHFINKSNLYIYKLDYLPIFVSIASIAFVSVLDMYTYNTIAIEIISSLVDEIGSLIVAYNKKGIVVYTNKELLRIFKVEENNVIGIDIKNKNEITKKVSEEFYNNLINPKNDNYLELNSIKYKTTVEKFEINKNDNLTCIVFSDITQELNFQKKLEDLAVKDSLTGLGNRYKLDMDINKFNKQKLKNISVVVIDLDNLKITNDIFGHNAGDRLIINFVEILNKNFKECSLGIYRLGGDEFCVILSDTSHFALKTYLENLYIMASEYNKLNSYQLLFSIGCAEESRYANKINDLYKFADVSMYRSKNEGKNKVTFFSKSIYDNFVLQNNLKKDLENGLKNNEIKVYYQPILSVKENKITRCEALVRWNHNLYGLISPSKFFDVAKELNLISNIDFIVMESACITLKNWLLKNYNTKIQLNLYFETLAQAEFVKKLCDILNKHNIEPSSIIFEIIEDERVNDNAFVIKNIIKMRQLGIQFAIDNYGQGFSDFSALKKFKPNYIKIDQTLIKVIGEDKIKIKNIGLLVNFLKTFKGEIIAVGVETSSQNKILSELKIDYLQGYFYGKAVDVEEYEKLYLN